MGFRTLGILLVALCVMTAALVSGDNMATNSTANTHGASNETVAQLLADVQAAVDDDPALANMFDIPSTDEMSEKELATYLRGVLTASLSGDSVSPSDAVEPTQDAPAAGPTVSDASTIKFSMATAVLTMAAALGATL